MDTVLEREASERAMKHPLGRESQVVLMLTRGAAAQCNKCFARSVAAVTSVLPLSR